MSEQPLAKRESQLAPVEQPSVATMLQTALSQGISKDNADALGKMMELYERMEDRRAEQAFAQAFVRMQTAMPQIQATKPVPNKDGTVRYKFAPYDEIWRKVRPHLEANGFSVRFSQKVEAPRITMTCTLMHVDGHSASNEFSVRIGQGPPGASETQADGSAATYAQRGALCDALGISITNDDDGNTLGAPIAWQQAEELRNRVKACGANEEQFLKFAGVFDYELIPEAAYERLDAVLRKKEAKQ